MGGATSGPGGIPPSELEALVFSGAYELVSKRAAAGYSDAEAPAVIGALALSGRLDEAESVFDARVRGRPALEPRARFFLIAGHCHAGNSARALAIVRQSAGGLRRGPPSDRFWACQGLALLRHFEGHLSRARRVARRALAAAVEADFPYGRFLSLDLLAHVAVHLGSIHAGMRLLTQASELADALGYSENAATERAAHLLFQLRFWVGGEATERSVQALVAAPGVSYFTRRNAWLELSSAHALRGDARGARAALEEARRIALTGADRRARARYFIGDALCSALSHGAEAATPSLAEARREAQNQLTLSGEIAFVEIIFCGQRAPPALTEAEHIARATGVERVRVAALLASGADPAVALRMEDGLCRLLLELSPLPRAERVRRVIEAGQLGLVPWALGGAPGRRLLLQGTWVVTEHHGNVARNELKNRPAKRLLAELGRGYRSRPELMRDVWSIGTFVPGRHTPTLHTAISRLRVALAEPDWIVTHDDGYSLATGVEVLFLDEADATDPTALAVTSIVPPPDDRQRVLAHIERHGACGSAEVAQALRLSGSTALRLLRALCAEGQLDRQGSGRATRYSRRAGA